MENPNQYEGLAKLLGGTSLLVLPPAACLGAGVYKGTMNANGVDVDIPFIELWAANMAGTGLGSLLLKEEKQSGLNISSLGVAFGTVAAPLEFAIAYGLAYAGTYIGNNLF